MAYDKDTEQLYDRARYIQVTTDQFMSEDPSSFGGGDANLRRVAGNNAPNAKDPNGLASWSWEGACIGAGIGTFGGPFAGATIPLGFVAGGFLGPSPPPPPPLPPGRVPCYVAGPPPTALDWANWASQQPGGDVCSQTPPMFLAFEQFREVSPAKLQAIRCYEDLWVGVNPVWTVDRINMNLEALYFTESGNNPHYANQYKQQILFDLATLAAMAMGAGEEDIPAWQRPISKGPLFDGAVSPTRSFSQTAAYGAGSDGLGFNGPRNFLDGPGQSIKFNGVQAKGTFVDQMEAGEALSYRQYWQREAPTQIGPGPRSTMDWKLSSTSDNVYQRVSYYDLYGRLEGQTHYTTHPGQPGWHPDPHYHIRNSDWVAGDNQPEWRTNPTTGTKVFLGEYLPEW